MDGDWLTYREAAERLNCTAEAARYRAMRGRWARKRGNDGRARIQLPDEPPHPVEPPLNPRSTPVRKAFDPALLHALEAHVATLKTENERLAAQLGDAAVDLATERARTSAAISAFAALAERLDQLAADASANAQRQRGAWAAFRRWRLLG
jgi:hypothetical protein